MHQRTFDEEPAWARAMTRMDQAAEHAEHVEPGWKQAAAEAVRLYALSHERFIAQDVELSIPADADPRAVGAIFQRARRAGWVKADGFALDRWGSHKTIWRSLICTPSPQLGDL
jgi:hypothetical protein